MKIGQRGLKPHHAANALPNGVRSPSLPKEFDTLDEGFFSVGQDDDYYANLNALGDLVREQVLRSLRDVAFDEAIWRMASGEDVMAESLLRSVTTSTVVGQFRRMAHGDARLTPFKFSYSPPKRIVDGVPPLKLDFSVDPESSVPTNIHVLIGRNGVGKTRLLSLMAKALVATEASAKQSGKFDFGDETGAVEQFANVVAVSFSAFDEGDLLPEGPIEPGSLGYAFIGLREAKSDSQNTKIRTKSPAVLAREFLSSLQLCQNGERKSRWIRTISSLRSDPGFLAAELTSMITKDLKEENDCDDVLKTFRQLSSGHKIVLLTLTRLVEKTEEKTLVLFDEPEAHLHPPLLSAMTRAISELLVTRNGVAILATHSPVILQEVPKSCVWILTRTLTAARAERPRVETFAESVGILSREVFDLELSHSGYHKLLFELRSKIPTYEAAVRRLDGALGDEGKAVLKAMYLKPSK